MIVLDVDVTFSGMTKITIQKTLRILVHKVSKGNHKGVINEGFHSYFNKAQKINSAEKVSIKQWLQGVFFTVFLECRSCKWNLHLLISSGDSQRVTIPN